MAPLKNIRTCKNPDCAHPEFTPRRRDQQFCDQACKNQFNNKKRLSKQERYSEEKIIRANCNKLEKLYKDPRYTNGILDIIIKHEDINLQYNSRNGINEISGNKVIWFYHYGLELMESKPYKLFKIHKR